MKKLLLILSAFLIIYGCQKTDEDYSVSDKWNGYESFYKNGPVTRTLYAGQTIPVGTIVYEFIEQDNEVVYFSVTYNTTGGWEISETHLYAGQQSSMLANKYVNKQLIPKIGLFPYSSTHNPTVTAVNYMIPIGDLPGYDLSGFILATHAVVINTNNGQNETAWGDWDETWNDKRWGGYITDLYQEWAVTHPILYGIQNNGGDFELKMIDLTGPTSNIISTEPVGETNYDGIAIMNLDLNPLLFYTTSNITDGSKDLVIDDLSGETEPYIAGSLTETAGSAVIYGENYYYLSNNDIFEVTFSTNENGQFEIATDNLLYEIPDGFTANDMAITDQGLIYIIGNDGINIDLNSYDLNSGDFDSNYELTNSELTNNTQLVYIEDTLYTVTTSESGTSTISALSLTSNNNNNLEDVAVDNSGDIIVVGGGRR